MTKQENHHPGKGSFAGLTVIELGASVAAPFAWGTPGELAAPFRAPPRLGEHIGTILGRKTP